MFYTRSKSARNRQILAIMVSGSQHRFTEGRMRQELEESSLAEPALRNVELSAYKRAKRFEHNTSDWTKIQTLMYELQTELDRLYG